MKEILNDTAENRISFFLLAFFEVLLPFDYFYSQLVLGCFALHTVIHCNKSRLRLLLAKETWLPALVYLLLFISITYSSDKKEGLNISGRQTAILLMPVLFALSNFDTARYKMPLLQIFAGACTGVILYLYADAIYTLHYFNLPLKDLFTGAFTNQNFSSPIGLHATYMAMYAGLSLAVMMYVFVNSVAKSKRIIAIACGGILGCGIFQLGSRAVMVAILLVFAAGIGFFLLQGKKKWLVTGIAILLSLAAGLSAMQTTAFKQRYVSELKNDLANQPVPDERLEPRISRWRLAMDIIKTAPVWGHGNGSEKELLKEKYFANKLYISFLRGFNAHSQYLSFLIRCGVLGLLLFLTVLTFAYRKAFVKKDFLFFSFLLLVSTVAVSENILDVNKGIFFYSFFLSFFLSGGTYSKATPTAS